MRWIRAEIPDNITKSQSDVYKDFYESQDISEHHTPIMDEGLQNSIDASDGKKIPKIKISHVKVDKSFFNKFVGDEFIKWNEDSMILDHFSFQNKLKNNKEIDCLIFEDFNTSGVKGIPSEYKTRLDDKSRNDYHIFIYYVGAPAAEKEKSKGGNVGVGRLTFAFASEINTFFMYTKQKQYSEKSYFIGLTHFGKSKNNSSLDPMARYGAPGTSPKGNPIAAPIEGEGELKVIRDGFKLKRQASDHGTSMIVPLPKKSITYDALIVNTLKRYRYSLYHGHFEVEIGNTIINKNTLLDVIKSKLPMEAAKYEEYFKFLDECETIDQQKTYIKMDQSLQTENPSRLKSEFFTEEELNKISDDYKNERVIPIRLPLNIRQKVEDEKRKTEDVIPVNTFVDIYLKKTHVKFGMDDIMRGPMPVSGERKLEGLDVFGLVKINDEVAHEFFRKLESPNHRVFGNPNQEFEKKYDGYRHQRALVTSALETLRTIIIDKDNEFSSDATQDFFSFGSKEDQGRDKDGNLDDVDTDGETPFNVPIGLFENPKAYTISKLHTKELAGFKLTSNDLKKSCEDTINKIEDFINKNKDRKEYTKKLDKRLNDQISKLSGWSEKKRLNELYPAKIYVQCAEDVEGAGDVSYSLHDNEHDFDLSNNLKHEIFEEKNGEIDNVEISGNRINITVNGPDFSYVLKTNAFLIEATTEHADLRFSAYMKKINI